MRRISTLIIAVVFILNSLVPVRAQGLWSANLPEPGTPVGLTAPTTPVHLIGLTLDQQNPLVINFLINKGDHALSNEDRPLEYKKVIKYFLAAMTIPDDEQWVNLSPYEKDRIIPDEFGLTEMGRDLLAQDYILKQLTASLIHPDESLGKRFWDKVYEKAFAIYGTTDIPLDTFNKVWIVPDEAAVLEKDNSVVLLKTHLKVMLETDYLAQSQVEGRGSKEEGIIPEASGGSPSTVDLSSSTSSDLTKQVVREIILPELENEVNNGEHFANLRQIVGAMVLATWYKKTMKASLLGEIYADKARVKGVDQNPANNQEIYKRYVKAFKKGIFNLIKEDRDRYTDELIPRKYFSGGFTYNSEQREKIDIFDTSSLPPNYSQSVQDSGADAISGKIDSVTTKLREGKESIANWSIESRKGGQHLALKLADLTEKIKAASKDAPERAQWLEERQKAAVDYAYQRLGERKVDGKTVGNNEIASIVERYITDKEGTDIQTLLLEGIYTDKVLDRLIEISTIASDSLIKSLLRGVENGHEIRASQEEYESKYVPLLKGHSAFYVKEEIELFKNQSKYWKTEADWIARRKSTDQRWSRFNADGTLKTAEQESAGAESLLRYGKENLEPVLAEILRAFVEKAGLPKGAFTNVSQRTKGFSSALKKLEKLRSAPWAASKNGTIKKEQIEKAEFLVEATIAQLVRKGYLDDKNMRVNPNFAGFDDDFRNALPGYSPEQFNTLETLLLDAQPISIADLVDLLGGRIVVEDLLSLEKVMLAVEGMANDPRFTGMQILKKKGLLRKENKFIANDGKPDPYRAVQYTITFPGKDGEQYTFELQIKTFSAMIASDLFHNAVYKPEILDLPTSLQKAVREYNWRSDIEEAKTFLAAKGVQEIEGTRKLSHRQKVEKAIVEKDWNAFYDLVFARIDKGVFKSKRRWIAFYDWVNAAVNKEVEFLEELRQRDPQLVEYLAKASHNNGYYLTNDVAGPDGKSGVIFTSTKAMLTPELDSSVVGMLTPAGQQAYAKRYENFIGNNNKLTVGQLDLRNLSEDDLKAFFTAAGKDVTAKEVADSIKDILSLKGLTPEELKLKPAKNIYSKPVINLYHQTFDEMTAIGHKINNEIAKQKWFAAIVGNQMKAVAVSVLLTEVGGYDQYGNARDLGRPAYEGAAFSLREKLTHEAWVFALQYNNEYAYDGLGRDGNKDPEGWRVVDGEGRGTMDYEAFVSAEDGHGGIKFQNQINLDKTIDIAVNRALNEKLLGLIDEKTRQQMADGTEKADRFMLAKLQSMKIEYAAKYIKALVPDRGLAEKLTDYINARMGSVSEALIRGNGGSQSALQLIEKELGQSLNERKAGLDRAWDERGILSDSQREIVEILKPLALQAIFSTEDVQNMLNAVVDSSMLTTPFKELSVVKQIRKGISRGSAVILGAPGTGKTEQMEIALREEGRETVLFDLRKEALKALGADKDAYWQMQTKENELDWLRKNASGIQQQLLDQVAVKGQGKAVVVMDEFDLSIDKSLDKFEQESARIIMGMASALKAVGVPVVLIIHANGVNTEGFLEDMKGKDLIEGANRESLIQTGYLTSKFEKEILPSLAFTDPEVDSFTKFVQGLPAAYLGALEAVSKGHGYRATYSEMISQTVQSVVRNLRVAKNINPQAAGLLEQIARGERALDERTLGEENINTLMDTGLIGRMDGAPSGALIMPPVVRYVIGNYDVLSKQSFQVDQIESEVAGLSKIGEYLDAPHYNADWHIEGGLSARLRDHLQVMLDALNTLVTKGRFDEIDDGLRNIINNVNTTAREDLEAVLLFHDIGKAVTASLKKDNLSHSFKGHEDASRRIITDDNQPTYKGRELSKQVHFAVDNHGLHYTMADKSVAEFRDAIAQWRKDYGESLDVFKKAMELLLSITTLDAMGSVTSSGRHADLDPVNKLFEGYKLFLAEQKDFAQSSAPAYTFRVDDLSALNDGYLDYFKEKKISVKEFEKSFFMDFVNAVRDFLSANRATYQQMNGRKDFLGALKDVGFYNSADFYSLVNKYFVGDVKQIVYEPLSRKDLDGKRFSRSKDEIFDWLSQSRHVSLNDNGDIELLQGHFSELSRDIQREFKDDADDAAAILNVLGGRRKGAVVIDNVSFKSEPVTLTDGMGPEERARAVQENVLAKEVRKYAEDQIIKRMVEDRFLTGNIIAPELAFTTRQYWKQMALSFSTTVFAQGLAYSIFPAGVVMIGHMSGINSEALEALNVSLGVAKFNTAEFLLATIASKPTVDRMVDKYKDKLKEINKQYFAGLLHDYVTNQTPASKRSNAQEYGKVFARVERYFKNKKGLSTLHKEALQELREAIAEGLKFKERYWRVGGNLSDTIALAESGKLPVGVDEIIVLALKELVDDNPDYLKELESKWLKEGNAIFLTALNTVSIIKNEEFIEKSALDKVALEIDSLMVSGEMFDELKMRSRPTEQEVLKDLFSKLQNETDDKAIKKNVLLVRYFLGTHSRLKQIVRDFEKNNKIPNSPYVDRLFVNVEVMSDSLKEIQDSHSEDAYGLKADEVALMIDQLGEAKKDVKDKLSMGSNTDKVELSGLKGGIDLNSSNLNLQIKRDGNGVPLPISMQNLESIRIDGLTPEIISIHPVTHLPVLDEALAEASAPAA